VKKRRAVHSLTYLKSMLECESCLMKISPPEMQMAHPSISHGNAVRMADGLRDANRFRASGDGFDKLPALSQR
jgi:hypothetical protein